MNFLTSNFPTSFLNCPLSIVHYPLFPRPHLIIGAPDLRSERAVRQKTSCLSRRKAASYLSFSEQAAIGSMRRCSLDLFCILFYIKAKKYVGFGAKPQESMDNAQCTIDWFDDLSIYWWIPGSAGVMIFWWRSRLRVFAPSWQIKVLPFRQVSDDDSCRRLNSAVMKIRLFKPELFSIHIHRSGSLQFTG